MAWRRGQTSSQDLRDRVLGAGHLTARQAAKQFAVSTCYVVQARQPQSRAGSVAPRPQKPPVAYKLVHLNPALQERVTVQIVRDWVLKFYANGPAGLIDRKPPDKLHA